MTNDIKTKEKKGLSVGIKAPLPPIKDIYDNPIEVPEILTQCKGILIDFFRGAF